MQKSDWVQVNDFDTGRTYVDQASLKVSGAVVMATVRYVMNSPLTHTLDPRPYLALLCQEEFDCQSNRVRVHSVTYTYTDGASSEPQPKDPKWFAATGGYLRTLEFVRGAVSSAGPRVSGAQAPRSAADSITLFDPLRGNSVISIGEVNRRLRTGELPPHAPALWTGSSSLLPVGFAPGADIRAGRAAAVTQSDSIVSYAPSPAGSCALLTKVRFLGIFGRPRTSVFPQASGGPLSGFQVRWATSDPSLLLELHEATADYVSCLGVATIQASINRLGFSFWQIHAHLNRYVSGAI